MKKHTTRAAQPSHKRTNRTPEAPKNDRLPAPTVEPLCFGAPKHYEMREATTSQLLVGALVPYPSQLIWENIKTSLSHEAGQLAILRSAFVDGDAGDKDPNILGIVLAGIEQRLRVLSVVVSRLDVRERPGAEDAAVTS